MLFCCFVLHIQVIRINKQSANVEIICVGKVTLHDRFRGIIRRENMRAEEVDRVVVQQSMRPGDIVAAEVCILNSFDPLSKFLNLTTHDHGAFCAYRLCR